MAAKYIDVGLYSPRNEGETTRLATLGVAAYFLATGEWLLLALLALVYVTVMIPPESAGKTAAP